MDSSLMFLYIVFFISIGFYVVSLIIIVLFIVPLQFKQAMVKNGLVKLRKQLLSVGLFLSFVCLASIGALTTRYVVGDPSVLRYVITSNVLINATSVLVVVVVIFKIYHQQYSPESLELHKKIAKLEEKKK